MNDITIMHIHHFDRNLVVPFALRYREHCPSGQPVKVRVSYQKLPQDLCSQCSQAQTTKVTEEEVTSILWHQMMVYFCLYDSVWIICDHPQSSSSVILSIAMYGIDLGQCLNKNYVSRSELFVFVAFCLNRYLMQLLSSILHQDYHDVAIILTTAVLSSRRPSWCFNALC